MAPKKSARLSAKAAAKEAAKEDLAQRIEERTSALGGGKRRASAVSAQDDDGTQDDDAMVVESEEFDGSAEPTMVAPAPSRPPKRESPSPEAQTLTKKRAVEVTIVEQIRQVETIISAPAQQLLAPVETLLPSNPLPPAPAASKRRSAPAATKRRDLTSVIPPDDNEPAIPPLPMRAPAPPATKASRRPAARSIPSARPSDVAEALPAGVSQPPLPAQQPQQAKTSTALAVFGAVLEALQAMVKFMTLASLAYAACGAGFKAKQAWQQVSFCDEDKRVVTSAAPNFTASPPCWRCPAEFLPFSHGRITCEAGRIKLRGPQKPSSSAEDSEDTATAEVSDAEDEKEREHDATPEDGGPQEGEYDSEDSDAEDNSHEDGVHEGGEDGSEH